MRNRAREKKKKLRRMREAQQVAAVRVAVTFTKEQAALIGRAANSVWNDIAYDLLTAGQVGLDKDDRRRLESRTMTRAEVIEAVSGCGWLEEKVRVLTRGADGDLVARVRGMGPEEMERLLTPAFPHEEYGL